jgi:hypothetical protein
MRRYETCRRETMSGKRITEGKPESQGTVKQIQKT